MSRRLSPPSPWPRLSRTRPVAARSWTRARAHAEARVPGSARSQTPAAVAQAARGPRPERSPRRTVATSCRTDTTGPKPHRECRWPRRRATAAPTRCVAASDRGSARCACSEQCAVAAHGKRVVRLGCMSLSLSNANTNDPYYWASSVASTLAGGVELCRADAVIERHDEDVVAVLRELGATTWPRRPCVRSPERCRGAGRRRARTSPRRQAR
jgi:hypothetical protein